MRLSKKQLTNVTVVLLSFALVSLLVVRTSSALFTATTDSAANEWETGSVLIGDDDLGAAMFTTAGDGLLSGGVATAKCITVTYSGTYTSGAEVHVYGSATGALAPYLDVVIEEGTGGGFGDCTGFTGTQIYSGTLANFSTNVDDFANGVGTWEPSANPQDQVYRISVTPQNVANAQGKTATGTFTWEAQA